MVSIKYPKYKKGSGLWEAHKEVSKKAWIKQESVIEAAIERLEAYPTCMSCYLKHEESVAASQLKWKFIDILKKELLDE